MADIAPITSLFSSSYCGSRCYTPSSGFSMSCQVGLDLTVHELTFVCDLVSICLPLAGTRLLQLAVSRFLPARISVLFTHTRSHRLDPLKCYLPAAQSSSAFPDNRDIRYGPPNTGSALYRMYGYREGDFIRNWEGRIRSSVDRRLIGELGVGFDHSVTAQRAAVAASRLDGYD
jgi:hypothetical protein